MKRLYFIYMMLYRTEKQKPMYLSNLGRISNKDFLEIFFKILKEQIHANFTEDPIVEGVSIYQCIGSYHVQHRGRKVEIEVDENRQVYIQFSMNGESSVYEINLDDGSDLFISAKTFEVNIDDIRDYLYAGMVNKDHYVINDVQREAAWVNR